MVNNEVGFQENFQMYVFNLNFLTNSSISEMVWSSLSITVS